jgi:signal transduction histidine kinase
LRSPFVSIDFALQTIQRYGLENMTPEQRELLEQLAGSFKDVRQMVNNLVSYAGLLSKQGQLNLAPVDVQVLIGETAAALTPMAESRGLELQTRVAPDLTLPAGDRERIGEAIWHLLHNAIKFTAEGGRVTIRARAQNKRLIVEVEDTGAGLSEEQQERIWVPFTQLTETLKRGVEGLGLGLALVRYVAAAHGGEATVKSKLGLGSTFGFWLPLDPHQVASSVVRDFLQASDGGKS